MALANAQGSSAVRVTPPFVTNCNFPHDRESDPFQASAIAVPQNLEGPESVAQVASFTVDMLSFFTIEKECLELGTLLRFGNISFAFRKGAWWRAHVPSND